MYLIHWPIAAKQPGTYDFPIAKHDLLPIDFKLVWEAMEECQKLGLAKAIGVSNFSCKKLENLLAFAKIPPSVNQVSIITELFFFFLAFYKSFYFFFYIQAEFKYIYLLLLLSHISIYLATIGLKVS